MLNMLAKYLLLYSLLLIAVVIVNGSNICLAGSSHVICSDCHTRGRALKVAIVNELCLSCHPVNTMDHVLGVVPHKTPAGLPLDKEKKMTCYTCHEPHGTGTEDKLLRMDKATLCAACHSG